MAKILIKYFRHILFSFAAIGFAGCGSSFIALKDAAIDESSITGLNSNPQRNFYYDRNIGDSIALKHTFDVKGSFGTTTPAAGSNFLFVPDLAGRVYAFDLETGKKAGYVSEKGSVYSSPVIKNSSLIFPVVKAGGKYTDLFIYDLTRGKKIEEIEVEGTLKSEPIKTDDGVIYISEEGIIYKYNYNGSQAWRYEHDEVVYSSPALWNDLVIFGDYKGRAAAIKASDGSLVYKVKTGGVFLGGFTVNGAKVYAGDADGKLYCLSAESGKTLWSYDTKYKIEAFPAAAKGAVIIGNLHGDLYSLNAETGKEIWKTSTGGIINAAPAIFNDYIVQPDLNKKVYRIERETGKISKTLEYETRTRLTPILYNKFLILGIDNGRVLVYEIL